jgi:hypothetical protein
MEEEWRGSSNVRKKDNSRLGLGRGNLGRK